MSTHHHPLADAANRDKQGIGPARRPAVTITLLTQEQCGLCEHAKAVLQRVRADPATPVALTVVEVDLASEEGGRLGAAAGVLFAPGVLLDGRPFAHGRLAERRLQRALTRYATPC